MLKAQKGFIPKVVDKVSFDGAHKRPWQAMFASVSMFLFVSCTTPGDFGRDRPSVFNDDIVPAISNFVVSSSGQPVSDFALTEKEQLLRTYSRRISRGTGYPGIEEYLLSVIGSAKAALTQSSHRQEETGSGEKSAGLVVDVPENAKTSPYALKSEIDEDIILIARARILARSVVADDRLRSRRLAALEPVRQLDRDNVTVRARENVERINYIRYIAKLRVERYTKAIDLMSIADPGLNLKPVRASIKKLEIEVDRFSQRPKNNNKPNPIMLLDAA